MRTANGMDCNKFDSPENRSLRGNRFAVLPAVVVNSMLTTKIQPSRDVSRVTCVLNHERERSNNTILDGIISEVTFTNLRDVPTKRITERSR